MAPIERSSVDPKLMADGIEGILDVYEVRAKGSRREIANDLAAHFIATQECITEAEVERLRKALQECARLYEEACEEANMVPVRVRGLSDG